MSSTATERGRRAAWIGILAVTGILLVGISVVAFMNLLGENRRYETERRFRALREVSTGLDYHLSQLQKMRDSAPTNTQIEELGKVFAPDRQAYEYRRMNFAASRPSTRCDSDPRPVLKEGQEVQVQVQGCFRSRSSREEIPHEVETLQKISVLENAHSLKNGISTNNGVVVEFEIAVEPDTYPWEVSVPLADLVNEERARTLFDEIMVVGPRGRVLYQSESAPVPIERMDLDPSGGTAEKASGACCSADSLRPEKSDKGLKGDWATLEQIQVGGMNHLVFRVPLGVPFSLSSSEADRPTGEVLYVVGVLAADEFDHSVRHLPLRWLALLAIALACSLVAWPLLRLRFIGPAERLGHVAGLLVGASLVSGTGITTIVVLGGLSYATLTEHAYEVLERINRGLRENYGSELSHSLAELKEFDTRCLDASTAADQLVLGTAYPRFETAFCLDKSARIFGLRTVQEGQSPASNTNVQDREYYQRVRDKRLYRAPGSQGYFIQRLRTKSYSRKVAAISVPVDGCSSPSCPGLASVLLTNLQTFSNPVLPLGFEFAVVDNTGRHVVFHSDDRLTDVTDFIAETDDDPRLRALLRDHALGPADARYYGVERGFHIAPLDTTPWMAVTFYAKEPLQGVVLESILLSMSIFIGFVALLLVAASIVALVGKGHGAWIWPEDRKRPAYLFVWILAAMVIVGTALGIADSDIQGWPLLALLAGVSGILLGGSALAMQGRGGPDRRSEKVALGIVAVGVATAAPALFFWTPRWGWAALPVFLGALAASTNVRELKQLLARTGRSQPVVAIVHRRAYLLTLAAFLVALGVLPAAALYYDSLTLVTKRFQAAERRHVARQFVHREGGRVSDLGELGRKIEALGEKAGLPAGIGIYLGGQVTGPSECKESSTECENEGAPPATDSWPEDPRGLLHFVDYASSITPANWSVPGVLAESWYRPSSENTRRKLWLDSFGDDPSSRIDANEGLPSSPDNLLHLSDVWPLARWNPRAILITILSLLAFGGLWAALVMVGRRLFGLELVIPQWDASAGLTRQVGTRGRLVVRADEREKADELQAMTAYGDGTTPVIVDLALLPIDPRKRLQRLRKKTTDARKLVVDSFETCLLDRRFRSVVLEILDRIVAESGGQLLIFSEVSPIGRINEILANEQKNAENEEYAWDELLAWLAVFGKLEKARLDLDPLVVPPFTRDVLRDECGWAPELAKLGSRLNDEVLAAEKKGTPPSDDEIVWQVRDRAEPFFRRLWAICSVDERLSLLHLAQGSLVNPESALAVEQLMRRGVVVRRPDFQIVSRAFADFVTRAEPRWRIARWERGAAQESIWPLLRLPFIILVAGLGIVVAYGSKDYYEAMIGAVPAMVALLPLVRGILSAAQEKRVATVAKPEETVVV